MHVLLLGFSSIHFSTFCKVYFPCLEDPAIVIFAIVPTVENAPFLPCHFFVVVPYFNGVLEQPGGFTLACPHVGSILAETLFVKFFPLSLALVAHVNDKASLVGARRNLPIDILRVPLIESVFTLPSPVLPVSASFFPQLPELVALVRIVVFKAHASVTEAKRCHSDVFTVESLWYRLFRIILPELDRLDEVFTHVAVGGPIVRLVVRFVGTTSAIALGVQGAPLLFAIFIHVRREAILIRPLGLNKGKILTVPLFVDSLAT